MQSYTKACIHIDINEDLLCTAPFEFICKIVMSFSSLVFQTYSFLVNFSSSILNVSIIAGTGLVVTTLIQEQEMKRIIHFLFYNFKYKLTTTTKSPSKYSLSILMVQKYAEHLKAIKEIT